MSKVYPRHGGGGGGAGGGGQRIPKTSYQQPARQQQQQQQRQQQQQYSSQQRQSRQSAEDDYWPSMFTILCSIPVILILYHYLTKILSKLIWGSLTISVEVSGPRQGYFVQEDRLYHWLLDWLSRHTKNLQNTTVRLKTRQDNHGKKEARLVRYPGFGITHFNYKGVLIRMDRISMPEVKCNDIPYEKITLTFVSSRKNRTLLYELLDECKPKKEEDEEEQKKVTVWSVDKCCWTEIGNPRKTRSLRSVVLAENTSDKLIGDIRDYLDSEEWYTDRGIPYRRGYLLYGPPGCGKSSLVRGIAGEIGHDICILSLSARGMTDDSLNMLMNSTPDSCIILLEDIDVAFKSRQDDETTQKEKNLAYEAAAGPSTVTFGGLLSALDGVGSTEGRIVFMTTNHIENLDPALTRPGRVDMKLLIDYPNDDQLRTIFCRFYPEAGIRMKNEFTKRVSELRINVTMAQIQGLFMFYKQDGQDAIDNMQEYFQDQFMVSELEPDNVVM